MSAPLCDNGTHVITKMDRGLYICANCGMGFHEHHVLNVQVSAGANQGPHLPRPAVQGS